MRADTSEKNRSADGVCCQIGRDFPPLSLSLIFLCVCACSMCGNCIFEGIHNHLVRMPVKLAHHNKLRSTE